MVHQRAEFCYSNSDCIVVKSAIFIIAVGFKTNLELHAAIYIFGKYYQLLCYVIKNFSDPNLNTDLTS